MFFAGFIMSYQITQFLETHFTLSSLTRRANIPVGTTRQCDGPVDSVVRSPRAGHAPLVTGQHQGCGHHLMAGGRPQVPEELDEPRNDLQPGRYTVRCQHRQEILVFVKK